MRVPLDVVALICKHLPPHKVEALYFEIRGLFHKYAWLHNKVVLPYKRMRMYHLLLMHFVKNASKRFPLRIYDRDDPVDGDGPIDFNKLELGKPMFYVTLQATHLDLSRRITQAQANDQKITIGDINDHLMFTLWNYVLKDRLLTEDHGDPDKWVKLRMMEDIGFLLLHPPSESILIDRRMIHFLPHNSGDIQPSFHVGRAVFHGEERGFMVELWETKRVNTVKQYFLERGYEMDELIARLERLKRK